MKLRDIVKHEIIGLQVRIAGSKNKANLGVEGKIIDETKSTITIKTKKGRKMLFKNNIKIELKIGSRKILVDGSRFAGRPEERIKK